VNTNSHIKTCVVIGDPISHSLSPLIHNAAFKALGIEGEYQFKGESVAPSDLEKYIQEVRAKNIHMLAVTIPHKETILACLDEVNTTAKEIGAVNTVINEGGKLVGYNTDCPGAINALLQHEEISGRNAVVLGSGGTARAIVYGLLRENVNVTICSRNDEKAKELSVRYKCNMLPWNDRALALNADIIINTTPIGREGEAFPIIEEGIKTRHIVFDANYSKKDTPLVTAAKQKNATAISGLELLLQQGMIQFELYTGIKAPEDAMRAALQNIKSHEKTV